MQWRLVRKTRESVVSKTEVGTFAVASSTRTEGGRPRRSRLQWPGKEPCALRAVQELWPLWLLWVFGDSREEPEGSDGCTEARGFAM